MSKNKKLKIQTPKAVLQPKKFQEKFFSLDFSCLTDDVRYNFYDMRKNGNIDFKSLRDFFNKLEKISLLSIAQISQLDRKNGFELLNRNNFKVKSIFSKIDKKYPFTKDMAYHVFRFGAQEHRIICKQCEKEGYDTVLFVLAIDWDLSTYRH